MNVPTSYHARGALAPQCIHDLRFLYTEYLELESRHHKEVREEQRRAGIDTADVDLQIDALDAELVRRAALYLQSDELPPWPRLDDERYAQLLEDARELKAIWPLADFLTRVVGLELHGRGPGLAGDCPFHQSKSRASFKVSTEKNVWHCFGCNKGGDLFRFVGGYYDVTSFPDQVRKVEEVTATMWSRRA
ncbi:MAG TPA: CHC2 zinc finger domain-containing protein [Thermomicrobiales bacterium]|nr:CHC2 zinc finger domain-containing protein [Thermomicrobiales bacterium]